MMLLNKNAVVTGCNRGIGKAILKIFAENGANIWACARKPTVEFETFVKQLAEQHGVEIWPVYFDLTDFDQIKSGVKLIMSTKRPLDVLVNNAGTTYNALFEMSTVNMMREVFEVNFFAPMVLSQYIVKLMTRNGKGAIVNIASTAGLDGNAGRSIYGASKSAVICATKAMASELGEKRIRVNAVAPGITQTDMLDSMTEEVIQETLKQGHIKRPADPEEIAKVTLFLASDMSSYVTGQVYRVDGGLG